jgi:hypothetical protein
MKLVIELPHKKRNRSDPHLDGALLISEFSGMYQKFSLVIDFEEGRLEHVIDEQYLVLMLSEVATNISGIQRPEDRFTTLKRPRHPV